MDNSPVSFDSLIAYVEHRHPDGDPLARLSDAVLIGSQLNEQGDALIGHYVDQARRSGASWSQIGASMGVTKQAAQQRFVGKAVAFEVPGDQLFSRFTPRAGDALATAAASAHGGPVEAEHIAVGAVADPDGLAGRIAVRAGLDAVTLATALQVALARTTGATPEELRDIDFAESGGEVLKGTLRAVLSLSHNYVGTEHLLLGAVLSGTPAAAKLVELGLDEQVVRAGIAEEVARITAERRGA